MHIGVVGAGVGGLAIAIRAAAAGHTVTMHEAAPQVGGKLGQLSIGGYRWDTGPSLFTWPELVTELLALVPRPKRPKFEYERLDPIARYFFASGKRLVAHADPAKLAEEAATALGENAAAVLAYLAKSGKRFNIVRPLFLERGLGRRRSYLNGAALRGMLALPGLGLFSTLHAYNKAKLRTPEMRQYFDRYATYNGSDPYRTPGLMSLIAHLEHNQGAYWPQGGMRRIAEVLLEAALALGVHIQTNERVEKIQAGRGRVKGLYLEGSKAMYPYDVIVSNMDAYAAYGGLVPSKYEPANLAAQEPSSSAVILYWGVKGHTPELGMHNVLFSADYRAEFVALGNGQLADEPTVYIHLSCRANANDAPTSHENWFVLVNAPPDSGQDWAADVPRVKAQVLAALARHLGPAAAQRIAANIEVERSLTPTDIAAQTLSHRGALYGTASNNRMAAFARHANSSKDVLGLYWVGGSVHPGGGIPLCLLSGKIVMDCIEEDLAKELY